MNRIDLEGQHAIVTGGAQGIGRAVAERFLDSGAAVSLWDRDAALAGETAAALADRGTTTSVAVDVTDLASVEAATSATTESLGGIDVLVNCAGIAGAAKRLWEDSQSTIGVSSELLGVAFL